MQIELIPYYSKADSETNPFWVKSEVNDNWVCSCGTSWNEAITRQRQKLADMLTAPEAPLPFFIDV